MPRTQGQLGGDGATEEGPRSAWGGLRLCRWESGKAALCQWRLREHCTEAAAELWCRDRVVARGLLESRPLSPSPCSVVLPR